MYRPCTPYFHSGVRVSGSPLRNTSLTPSPLVSASNLSYSPSLYETLADNVKLSVTSARALELEALHRDVRGVEEPRLLELRADRRRLGQVLIATAGFGTQTSVTSARCASVYST